MDNKTPVIPKLYNVLASILCDISKAQDVANRYSLELAKHYRDHPSGLLKEFPVPNSVLDELKIDFKLIVEEIQNDEKVYNSLEFYRQAFESVADQIATDASHEIIKVLQDHIKENDENIIYNIEQIADFLNSTSWVRYLSEEIIKTLCNFAVTNSFVSLSTKPEKEVIDSLVKILMQKFVQHEDIVNMRLNNQVISNLQRILKTYTISWWKQILHNLVEYKKSILVPTLVGRIQGPEDTKSEQFYNFSVGIKRCEYNWDIVVQEDRNKTKVDIQRFTRDNN
ncbi:UNVERIFIED_CONTAM: hypothetical protein Cloal_2850 [Acetivibrio alkalicellulosi]